MAKKSKKGDWIVTVRATVTKRVCCEGCTEEEAQDSPFEHAVDETETEQIDWEVLRVEPNE